MHYSHAPKIASFNQRPEQICVTTLHSEPPNYLRVKKLPASVPVPEANHDKSATGELESFENKTQENTTDYKNDQKSDQSAIYTNMRDNKNSKKRRKLDEKFKRFSLNNLEEFRNSMVDLFDFSTPKERPQRKKTDNSILLESMYVIP